MKKQAWVDALNKYKYVALVALVGVVLLLWPIGEEKPQVAAQAQPRADPFAAEALEGRLQEALSQIQGAGEVTVVLTLASTPRQLLAQEEKESQGGDRTERESQVVLASKGSGTQEPVALQELAPSYRGALVVSPGAGDPAVRLALTEAVAALTGLGTDKISICMGK